MNQDELFLRTMHIKAEPIQPAPQADALGCAEHTIVASARQEDGALVAVIPFGDYQTLLASNRMLYDMSAQEHRERVRAVKLARVSVGVAGILAGLWALQLAVTL